MLNVALRSEIRKGCIGVLGMFVMLKGFRQGIFMVGSPAGNILGILDYWISRGETALRVRYTAKFPLSFFPAILERKILWTESSPLPHVNSMGSASGAVSICIFPAVRVYGRLRHWM